MLYSINSVLRFVYDDLRERYLHSLFIEQDLKISCKHALPGEYVFFRNVGSELKVDAAVSEIIHSKITRRRKIKLRMLLFQTRKRFL